MFDMAIDSTYFHKKIFISSYVLLKVAGLHIIQE